MANLAILENITEEELKIAVDAINRKRESETWDAKQAYLESELNRVLALIDEMGGVVLLNGGYVPVRTALNGRYESKVYIRNKKWTWTY